MRKKAILIFIHLFVAIGLALPLSYYTCRGDEFDERFAWRMFSSIRMVRCKVAFEIGPERKRAALAREFHEAWRTLASRGRRQVVTAMARELCRRNPGQSGQSVRVDLVCTTVDGKSKRAVGRWNLCEVDSL